MYCVCPMCVYVCLNIECVVIVESYQQEAVHGLIMMSVICPTINKGYTSMSMFTVKLLYLTYMYIVDQFIMNSID